MPVTRIVSSAAIPAGGHYSQAVAAGGLIFVSGQLGISRGEEADASLEQQTLRVLDSLKSILAAHGTDLKAVAKVTLYVTDIRHWPTIDALYTGFFRDHKPARAIVPVPELHYGSSIELEAVAVDDH